MVVELAVAREIEPRDPHAATSPVGGAQVGEHVLGALARERAQDLCQFPGVLAQQAVAGAVRQIPPQFLGDFAQRVLKRLRLRDLRLHQRAQLGHWIARRRALIPPWRDAVELDLVDPGLADRSASHARFFRQHVGVRAQPPSERGCAYKREPRHQVLARRRGARGQKPLLDPRQRFPAIFDAGKIDAKPLKLRNAGQSLFDRDLAVIAYRDQRRRLRPRLVDVAPLRISRHHDRRPAPLLEPLMNVAKRPIVKARAMKVGKPAGRVKAVSRRTAETRMQHADIHVPRPVGGTSARGSRARAFARS